MASCDVIVVGGRCAGAPLAMLLARRGYRVALFERSKFGTDTLSTHYLHQVGVRCLEAWGLLPELIASGCPPIRTIDVRSESRSLQLLSMHFASNGDAYCPRRHVLDGILVKAAAHAGVDVREHVGVQDLIRSRGQVVGVRARTASGAAVEERAAMTVGADGRFSTIARLVHASDYAVEPMRSSYLYSYWRGAHLEGGTIWLGKGRAATAMPTNDGLTCITAAVPTASWPSLGPDRIAIYQQVLEGFPRLAALTKGARRERKIYVASGRQPNFIRRSQGPGWALVGDAGYHKDPITALGISDAFRYASRLAAAIDAGLSGRMQLGDSLARYEADRNAEARPLFDFTVEIANVVHATGTTRVAKAGGRSRVGNYLYLGGTHTSDTDKVEPDNVSTARPWE